MSGGAEWIDFRGTPAVRIVAPDGASAILSAHGGHVVSWVPAGGIEQLYLSERSAYGPGAAIRGGVPVIFPQFAARGPYVRHGFARTSEWSLLEMRAGEDHATATFALDDTPATRERWPFAFHCELTASVGESRIDLELEVENSGAQALRFTCALHTYLAVDEVEAARLEGLRGARYLDMTADGAERIDRLDAVVVDAEVDRIYPDAPRVLALRDGSRTTGIRSEGFTDTVVWNPWESKCAQLADMPRLGFRRMLCVEAGAILRPVGLAPGEAWWGRQSLVALRSGR